MISLITCASPNEYYLDYFLQSAVAKLTLISEIIVCRTRMPPDYLKVYQKGNLEIKEVGNSFYHRHFSDMSHDHAFGLHHILSLPPKNDLVFISDTDVIFYDNVDEFYLNLMMQHELNTVGVARNNPQFYVQDYFPAVFNMLVRQSELPKEYISIISDGEEYRDKFFAFTPDWRYNPPKCFDDKPGWYDTGCLLYLWAKEKNWKWLSFLTGDIHNYSTQFYSSKPKIKIKLPRKKLIYHQSLAQCKDAFEQYKKQYEMREEENG